MHQILKLAIPAAILTLASTGTTPLGAASTVQATKPDCVTAWATLMSSHPTVHAGFPHADYKEAVMRVTGPATGFVAGASQSFELLTFDTRFYEGGTAYVAHCGSGATCNALGEGIIKRYPEAGTVYIHCMVEPPVVLENPQAF